MMDPRTGRILRIPEEIPPEVRDGTTWRVTFLSCELGEWVFDDLCEGAETRGMARLAALLEEPPCGVADAETRADIQQRWRSTDLRKYRRFCQVEAFPNDVRTLEAAGKGHLSVGVNRALQAFVGPTGPRGPFKETTWAR